MSREALMKFREDVLADDGQQQEIREVMATLDVAKAQAWAEEKDYTDVGFTTEGVLDFLENPGADVELSDLELEIVAGGYNLTTPAQQTRLGHQLQCGWPQLAGEDLRSMLL